MKLMEIWKIPPKAKIYEALSAIADKRVELFKKEALVSSSSGNKKYVVRWTDDLKAITSNDNGSYWQGYLGYPILAVLMLKKVIIYDNRIAEYLKGIPWKDINQKFKNNFDKAVLLVLDGLKLKGIEIGEIKTEVDKIYKETKKLRLFKLDDQIKPPEEY